MYVRTYAQNTYVCHIIKTYIIYFCSFLVENYCNTTSTTCLATGFGTSRLKAENMMYLQSNHCSDTTQPSRRQSTVGTGMCINTY